MTSNYGPDSLNPPYEGCSKAHRGEIIESQLVIACGDAPEILQSVESGLDAPTQLVETLVEAERLLPIGAIWNDWLGSVFIEFTPQFGTIIGGITEHAFRRVHSAD